MMSISKPYWRPGTGSSGWAPCFHHLVMMMMMMMATGDLRRRIKRFISCSCQRCAPIQEETVGLLCVLSLLCPHYTHKNGKYSTSFDVPDQMQLLYRRQKVNQSANCRVLAPRIIKTCNVMKEIRCSCRTESC